MCDCDLHFRFYRFFHIFNVFQVFKRFYMFILKAPSNLNVSALNIGLWNMCSTKAAYSDGCPSLLGCGTEFPSATRAFSGKAASKGVSNKPGQIVFTRI